MPDADRLEYGSAVVVDGVKYRVRELIAFRDSPAPATVRLVEAGPSWRRSPIVRSVGVDRLELDGVVGVWRVRSGIGRGE